MMGQIIWAWDSHISFWCHLNWLFPNSFLWLWAGYVAFSCKRPSPSCHFVIFDTLLLSDVTEVFLKDLKFWIHVFESCISPSSKILEGQQILSRHDHTSGNISYLLFVYVGGLVIPRGIYIANCRACTLVALLPCPHPAVYPTSDY